MENLDTGKDKIKMISEILRNETLDPAKEEAKKIIEKAQEEAKSIIDSARVKGEEMKEEAKLRIEKERELFQSSLEQSAKQSIMALRQDIEANLFNKEVVALVEKMVHDPKVIAELVSSLVKAIEKEGTSADFSAEIGASISPEKVNGLIAKEILKKLKEKSVVVGQFVGGLQLKLHDKKLTLDLSDKALVELLGNYLRKDFCKIFFGS